MLVTRNGTEVGRIQVSTVEPDEAEATVTDQGLGINTQDIATAIYQLPPISSAPGGDTLIGAQPLRHSDDDRLQFGAQLLQRPARRHPRPAPSASAIVALAVGHGTASGSTNGAIAVGNGQASAGPAVLTFNGSPHRTPTG